MAQRKRQAHHLRAPAVPALLFKHLMEAYANAEHVFTWLNTNGHTRTALLMYIVHHNDNL